MNITLDQLRVLVSVDTSGSFSATAELLGQTPSAISRKIGQLERQLDLQLFNRTTRRMSLTDEGRFVIEKAQHALSLIDDIQDSAIRPNAVPQGKLKIDGPTPFLEHCIIPHLDGFLSQYPKVEIEFANFDKQIDLIEQQIDIAFRIGKLKDSSLHYRHIGQSKLRILASPDYIKKHGLPASPKELDTHRCLGFSQPITLNNWPLENNKALSLHIKPSIAFSSGTLIRQAALMGSGIACLNDFMTNKDQQAGKLIQILEKWTLDEYLPINAVFYKPYQSSLKLKCFIDYIVKSIGNNI